MLLPKPARVERTSESFSLPAGARAFLAESGGAAADRVLLKELGAAGRSSDHREADILVLPAAEAPGDLRDWAGREEGYALSVDADGVRLWAATAAGRLYGAVTLGQLRRQFAPTGVRGDGRRLPGVRIADAPKLAHRGVQLNFAQGHTGYRRAYMRQLVPLLARWKINALYLYLETFFDFPSLRGMGGPGAVTPEDVRELQELCAPYHIMVVPQLNVLAHSLDLLTLQKFAGLAEYPAGRDRRTLAGDTLCSTSPAVRKIVDGILSDAMEIFDSPILHIGCDEVVNLGLCPRCLQQNPPQDKLSKYLGYIQRIAQVAREHGRRIGMWGDVLIKHRSSTSAQHKELFARLRQDAIIYDWHYEGGSPQTLEYFVKEGFQTVACSTSAIYAVVSLWPAQSANQRLLFGDAIRAGAMGGLTTGWENYAGLHEEHGNYLFATGATALWSGPQGPCLAPDLPREPFERAFSLHRYGPKTDAITQYWHVLGDLLGPVLGPLAPLNGASVRRCLYQCDNVLEFWLHYGPILKGPALVRYRRGVRQARELWTRFRRQTAGSRDVALPLHEGPLLMHEHLLKRLEMSEALYRLYDRAAKAQFDDSRKFTRLLGQAAGALLAHERDFAPVERYLRAAYRVLGLELASLRRLQATRKKMRELAALFRSWPSGRPLPAFVELHHMFLGQCVSGFYGDREHEWTEGPARFQRYTIFSGPVPSGLEQSREVGDRPRQTPTPRLPAGVTFEPIDLSPAANRSLADEGGEGWSGFGPTGDLRAFLTGPVTLAGVPYVVAPGKNNAVVLRANPNWVKGLAGYPDTVAIPVNKKNVAALLFLHAAGWARDYVMGERRVEYADGSAEVLVLDRTNTADWNTGDGGFPGEEGTLTTVAWEGTTEDFPAVRVYQTLWINPHPRKTIRQVVLTNAAQPLTQQAFLALLGLTAAVEPQP
jgi:hypothetical protein